MQAATLTIAVLALVVALYAALALDHLPQHIYANDRLTEIETWIRSRCAPGVSLGEACLDVTKIKAPPPATLFGRQ